MQVYWYSGDYIDYGTGSGGWTYEGGSDTLANEPLLLAVSSVGREVCGLWTVDIDWDLSVTQVDATHVSTYSDAGWSMAGLCSWVLWDPRTKISNWAWHQATNGSHYDDVRLDAWEYLP